MHPCASSLSRCSSSRKADGAVPPSPTGFEAGLEAVKPEAGVAECAGPGVTVPKRE